nr:uncharacterized protein LOC108009294 [Drosophila suzukii]
MDHTYALIYILLSGKSSEAYEHLFGFINQNIFQFEAASFLTDYDSDLRKALTAIFPKATLNSCWFHYCQALRQKSLSIKTFACTIKRNVNCYNWYQKFQSLALVDPRHIEPMLATLKLDLLNLPKESHKELQIFLKYFEEEWMIKITPHKFTVHRQDMTTTISLESFNTVLGRKLEKHCRFLKFLEVKILLHQQF